MSGPRLSEPQWQALESAAEARYSLPSGVLRTTRGIETGGRDIPGVPTKHGVAQGYYQTMPANVAKYGFNPHDPASAADGTARLWRDNLSAAGGNVQEAARMYNGSGPEARAYAAKFMGKQGGGKSAPININDMGFSEPDKPNIADMGFSDPGAATAQAAPQGAPAQAAPAQTDAGDTAPQDELSKARAEIDAMAGGEDGLTGVVHDNRPSPYDPSTSEAAGRGLTQGVSDMFDNLKGAAAKVPGAEQLWQLLAPGANTFGGGSVTSLADSAMQGNKLTQQYEQQLGNNTAAGLGRIGGNILATAPAMMAGGEGVAALTPRILAAAPKAAPLLDFLGGKAGTNMLTRAASRSANGAILGGIGGTLVGQNPLQSAEAGAVLSPVLGAAGSAARAAGNALAPKVDPYIAAMAQKAQDMGLNIRGSQISGSPAVRTVDSVLGRIAGTGMAADNAAQRSDFTRAISRSFGGDSPVLSEDVMQSAKTQVGNEIGEIAGRNRITDTNQLMDDLGEIEQNAHGALENPAPVNQQISNILNKIDGNGHLSGDDYQNLIRHGGPLDTLQGSSDGAKRNLASDIRDALDESFHASLSTEDSQAFRAARLKYKNLMTVKDLAAKSPDGTVSPALLQNSVTRSFKNRAFSGAGDLGDLGKIGQLFLKDQGSSNTAERANAMNKLANAVQAVGAVGAAAVGHNMGISPMEAIGTGIGVPLAASAGGRLVANMLRSPAYRNKLISSAVNDGSPPVNYMPYLVAPSVMATNRLRSASAPGQ